MLCAHLRQWLVSEATDSQDKHKVSAVQRLASQVAHLLTFIYKLCSLTQSLVCKWSALIVDSKHMIHLPDKTARNTEMSIMIHSVYLIFFFVLSFAKPQGPSCSINLSMNKSVFLVQASCRAGVRVNAWGQAVTAPGIGGEHNLQGSAWGGQSLFTTQSSEQAVAAEDLACHLEYGPKESCEVQEHPNLTFKLKKTLEKSRWHPGYSENIFYITSTDKLHLFIAEPLYR